jgi:hypothetical protein
VNLGSGKEKAPNPGDGWALHACVLRGASGGMPTLSGLAFG